MIAGVASDADEQIDYDSLSRNLVQLNKEAVKAAPSFGYDHVTGLPVVFGDPIDYDHDFVQTNKDAAVVKTAQKFGFDHVTGLPVVFGDPIDFDHDFVQFSGEPINVAVANRNLLYTAEDWMTAQSDYRLEHNIPEPVSLAEEQPEGIYSYVVRI